MTRTAATFLFLSVTLLGCVAPQDSQREELRDVRGPHIDDVAVAVDSSGLALITATATSRDGGPLLYAWGSRALSPPVLSEPQIVLGGAAVDPGTITAHLVVQDDRGLLATAALTFARDGACPLCGSRRVTIRSTPVDEPCVFVYEACIARCRGDAPVAAMAPSCASECAVGVAICRTNPS